MDEKELSISYDNIHHIHQTSPSPSNHSNYSHQNNQIKIIIVIGKFQQQYYLSDLQLLSYFEALFSSRWNNNNDNNNDDNNNNNKIVIGDNKSLQFSIEELSTIIHIKKYNRIPITYHYKKLQILFIATDFFSEDILNEELLIIYFKKCKPSLSFKIIKNELSKSKNKLISQSAIKYLKNINENINTMKEKWLSLYKILPISHVSYDNEMIGQMFVRSFLIQWVQMKNDTKRKWMIQCGNLKSFFNIWNIIKKRELYKYDYHIFECIEKMCNDIDISVPIHHNVDQTVLIILKKIFIETAQIVVGFNNEKKKKSSPSFSSPTFSSLSNIFNDEKNNTDNDEKYEQQGSNNNNNNEHCEYFDYHKFNLKELIRTHFEFVIVNRKQYFCIEELKKLLSIAHYMNNIQKYSFLKIILSFHKDLIENITNNLLKNKKKYKQEYDEYILCWKNLIKYLICSEIDYSINLVQSWLYIFIIDDSKFILNQVANSLNTDGSHKLGFAIANYLTNPKNLENDDDDNDDDNDNNNNQKVIDPQYMTYLYNSLGLLWKLNNTVLNDFDHQNQDNQIINTQNNDQHQRVKINLNDNIFLNYE